MPIYQYHCPACDTEHEILQKMSDEPAQVCPACRASGLQKQITAAGFRLAGTGWYETDFKTGAKKNLTGDATAASAPAAPPASTPAAAASPAVGAD
jgi:putative FmdB family regulatory protein